MQLTKEVEMDLKAQTECELGAAKSLCTPISQVVFLKDFMQEALHVGWGKPAKQWTHWDGSYNSGRYIENKESRKNNSETNYIEPIWRFCSWLQSNLVLLPLSFHYW
ncbi:hypothetical protein OPV22_034681 [Ensete ventricosum]|uniref:Uncharacterized protein n=1 Tax=Ensete ventricosum TaxID=4639 RepID=A0AAV8P3D8_ENSVE|nr:hypothetical protein OPV22_034681 [Ensete ventricosum]